MKILEHKEGVMVKIVDPETYTFTNHSKYPKLLEMTRRWIRDEFPIKNECGVVVGLIEDNIIGEKTRIYAVDIGYGVFFIEDAGLRLIKSKKRKKIK